MGKGKGEAWTPATIFISHIVALSRPQAIRTVNKSVVGHVTLCQSSSGNCGKLIVPSHIGAVAQLGERRLCTAEVRGSNPLGSTQKCGSLQVRRERSVKTLELIWGLVLQPILQRTFQDGLLAERQWQKFAVEQYRSKTSVIDAGAHAPRWSLIDDMTNRAGKDRD